MDAAEEDAAREERAEEMAIANETMRRALAAIADGCDDPADLAQQTLFAVDPSGA